MYRRRALSIGLLLAATPAAALELGWPVACTRGQDCWIVHYVDADLRPDRAADFTCGTLSYDGHNGTDIAVRDRRAMAAGVPVLAAADGTVVRVRDGVPERPVVSDTVGAIHAVGEECGNGVLIDHPDGWQSLYCHMKQDSVRVAPGQAVRRGEAIGAVGQSGLAEFPHLHLGILRDGAVIDPFTSAPAAGCDAASGQPLWAAQTKVDYDPTMLFAAGFAAKPPELLALLTDASSPLTLAADSSALVLWFMAYGVQAYDRISFQIRGPGDRSFLKQDAVQRSTRIRVMRYVGKRNRSGALPRGEYTGRVVLTRRRPDGGELRRVIERRVMVR